MRMRLRTPVLVLVAALAAVTAGAQWPGVDDEATADETSESGWPVSTVPADAGATGASFRCSVFGDFAFQGELRYGQSDSRIERMIDDIVKASGLKRNFEVVSSPDVSNAAAWVEGDRRMIGYNPRFLDDIVSRTGTDWAVKSIMAHEVGHHLQGHTLQRGGSRPPIELEADNYSGHIVRWLNGSLDDAQVAMRTLAPPRDSHTHPGRDRRLNAIADGWRQAGARSTGTGQPSQPNTQPSPSPRPDPSPSPHPDPSRFPRPNPPQVATACCTVNVMTRQIIPMCALPPVGPVGVDCHCIQQNPFGMVRTVYGVSCR